MGFVVDFYCLDEKLAVEIDGGIHGHQQGHDAERQKIIEAAGIRFVRLSDVLVLNDLDAAIERIKNAFGRSNAP